MEAPPDQPVSKRAARRVRRAQAQAEGKCTHTARSTGKRCKNSPVKDRPTCRMHGGSGGRPATHYRYSELPGRIHAACVASLTDETLFDSTQTVALLDGLVKEACARAADLDTPAFRRCAIEMLASAREQIVDGKDPIDAIGPLGALLDKGLSQVIAEDRLFRLGERLDARIGERNRIALAKQNSINSVDLIGVMQGLLAAIQRLAPPELAKLIADEIEKLLGGVDPNPPARETLVGRN